MHITTPCEKRLQLLFGERMASMAIAEVEAAGQAVSIMGIRLYAAQQRLRLDHESSCRLCRSRIA